MRAEKYLDEPILARQAPESQSKDKKLFYIKFISVFIVNLIVFSNSF